MKNGDFVIISAYSLKNNMVVDIKMTNAEAGVLTAFALIGCATIIVGGAKIGKIIVDKIKEKIDKKDERTF